MRGGRAPSRRTAGGDAGGAEEEGAVYRRLFHPGVRIPEEASRVHGITDRDVADAPRFAEAAAEMQGMFEGRTLCGYNVRAFDTPLLDAELRRAGQPGLDLESVEEIDLYRVWTALEPAEGSGYRTLERAVERYLGRTLVDAHAAAADTRVLPELLEAMRERHGLGREELLELSDPPDEVDRAGKLRRADGEVVFAFGKHAGEPVARHPDYVDWMLDADFPRQTKRILRRVRAEG
jgi:DNA polymerase-3 subunit epsilon